MHGVIIVISCEIIYIMHLLEAWYSARYRRIHLFQCSIGVRETILVVNDAMRATRTQVLSRTLAHVRTSLWPYLG